MIREPEAVWCVCGREAYIHYGAEILCALCYVSQLKDRVRGLFGDDANCMAVLSRAEAVLHMRRAQEDLRLIAIVCGVERP